MGRRKRETQDATLDMTPMIDVVFQLIIFFIVTFKITDQTNRDIILEDSPYGPVLEEVPPSQVIVEVDRRGWISMNGATMTKSQFRSIMKERKKRMGGEFPVFIRGDYRALHKDIRAVMDVCTEVGIWKIDFAAVQEHKATKGRHQK